ncbi:hypothetical protein H6802_01070 [Candidatus Nomurabacteria bacterium]|uniref:Uncharacterized protein n=1 Tax=candidate division WWE3 bacterium TaxID=2053526 RepID=A0A955E038_UNCKA|nr:hypothetical protein [candidate division WWE3 bacterium]MCB9823534.1 hypothetical protein [Candidatus Nomurabacteria bacterium]MCB9827329.1 hypothetical protein [Candidatus Nomurabacteria bacterium]HXK52485.1 hypothetical protein [bacterium]
MFIDSASTANIISSFFTPEGFVNLLQMLVLFLEFVYLLIAFLITRQISLMNKSFKTEAALLFTIAGYINFLGTAALLILSVATL